jgi:hypothetical protein
MKDRLRHGCRSRAYMDVFTACLSGLVQISMAHTSFHRITWPSIGRNQVGVSKYYGWQDTREWLGPSFAKIIWSCLCLDFCTSQATIHGDAPSSAIRALHSPRCVCPLDSARLRKHLIPSHPWRISGILYYSRPGPLPSKDGQMPW